MATTEVKPTRSELLEVKRKIKLTQSGYKILKMKRDGLILEFFKILEEAKQAREEASKQHEVAMRKINVAMAVDGIISVKSAAYAHKTHPEISVPSTYINEATEAFEELVETLTKAAEIETTLKKLLNEIEGTKRRVNALEFKVIPELQEAEAFIELRLEEMERDNLFSLKHLKGKAEAQE